MGDVLDDARMIELCEDVTFASEVPSEGSAGGVEDLESDGRVGVAIEGAKDLGHAAGAGEPLDGKRGGEACWQLGEERGLW